MYYRLAQPNEGHRKKLYGFLREAFGSSDGLPKTLRKLKTAIEHGRAPSVNGGRTLPDAAKDRNNPKGITAC